MRTFKKILLILIYSFFLSLLALFLWKPYLLNVLKYRTPNAETYKIFPQEVSNKSDSVFHFIRSVKQRNDLDTLHVLDENNRSIPLKDYLKNGQINVFIVIRNDSVLYERYNKGYSDSTLTSIFSGAKTMISIVVGQALADRSIKSLDDKLTKYIPELKSNPAFAQITLKNLLDMKSGLEFQDAFGGVIKAFFSDEAKYYYTNDMKAQLMKVKLVNKPGTVWVYKSIDPILLGWVLKKAAGKSVAQYFEANVWKQIGTEYHATWGLDQVNGLTNTASRFQVTAIDFAKIGRLYLNQGKYNGKQVVPESWVNQSTHIGTEKPASAKGWQKSAHHYLWWIPQEGDHGDYAAEGMLGQRLYVDPKTNTIIVQFADHGAGNYPYRKISRYLAGLPFSYPKS
ncbi:CubicO group peptidase, beta-lactamase class C family [Pedobacter terrae]|uniref:CubicO group peptidase, beta-lactamase class C family n=1 Tax=Pedobacter terrae TaxID=405671 RepID=A0A1G8CAY8_9SPHI|nr:serine hydrolase [Pedobacter terrae]SDH14237.1 CubicO group peptidase, beta-lactamase class C family [Pedobacter terrae]SDH42030.1 CubicO group peptidase, beta-lactamase class C family [Pedobacter terrae]